VKGWSGPNRTFFWDEAPVECAFVSPLTLTGGVHDFTTGNPYVGWRWYILLDRDSRGIKGPIFDRKDEAQTDCMEVCRAIARARKRREESAGQCGNSG
jgi:hypothetical protein